jgi:predicted PurR-regulated permease PerM
MTDSTIRRGRRLIFIAFAVAVALLAAWALRHALILIYVSAIFAVVLKPAVDWLHARKFWGWRPGRATALLLLVVLLCLFVGGLLAIALPSILDSSTGLARTMSSRSGTLQQRIHSIPVLKDLDLSALAERFSSVLGKLLPAAGSATADVVTSLLLIAYLILDGAALCRRALARIPAGPRERLDHALTRSAHRMRGWLTGQVMLMAILAISSGLTFGLMGLPYFYLLAVFAGAANLVPLLGPLATVVVAGVVAATQSSWDVLGVIVFYLVYQQVENAFLTPRIMKAQVELSPVIVIVALLVGGELAGIAGALVAVPSAVLVSEFVDEYVPARTAESKE